MLEPVKDLVDRRQRLELDIGLDLTLGGKGKRFRHILARSHERTPNGNTVRHHVEQWNRELAWRQPDQDTGPTLPGHANSLLKCGKRRRRNQNAMSSATSLFLQGGCRVASLGVDHEIGANLLGVGRLAVMH